jgi:hypothetical protein
MPVPILTTSSTVLCPHGGIVVLTTANALADIQGAPLLLETDVHAVVGCPFTIGPKYSPCVSVRWSAGAAQARVRGNPVLLQNSVGVCYSAEQAPQGLAIVAQVQPIALGL